jgi:hypothetical protein
LASTLKQNVKDLKEIKDPDEDWFYFKRGFRKSHSA